MTFRSLLVRVGRSELKTAIYTSGGYYKVSVVKVSARSDQIIGGSYVAQLNAVHEKLVLRKTQNKFE